MTKHRVAAINMNVLVLSLNPCNVGHLGCYGNPWIQTPALDRLAAESVVFDQYFGENVDPRSTRRAWWTGRYHLMPKSEPQHESAAWLPQKVSEAGVRTSLISDAACLAGRPALLRGFSDVVIEPTVSPDSPANVPRLVDAAVDWLDGAARSDPFLLWLDADALRPPWHPPEPFASMYEVSPDDEPYEEAEQPDDPDELETARYRYAAQISHVDACVGKLLDHLCDHRDDRTTVIIVLSDRGMPLGEHGVVGFDPPSLYEELVHVPLLIRMPDLRGAGTRTAALAQPVDLAPTVLELLSLPPIERMHGTSLVPLFERTGAKVRDAAVTAIPNQAWSLRTAQWHLITPTKPGPSVPDRHEAPSALAEGTSPELYLKPEDRWDQHNVAALYPDDVERLTDVLEQFAQAIAEDRVDQATSILRALPAPPAAEQE